MLPNHKQHEAIRQQRLTVSKLEEITLETFNGLCTEKNGNAKKQFLKELFRVAKFEEQYLNGSKGM